MVSTSINFPRDLLDEMDERVEESVVFTNRSQLVKAAVRTYLEDGGEEFDRAR